MTESVRVPQLVTVEVAPGTRMLVISDLGLAWRPTDTSLAIAAELAAALDTWVGPGVLVGNGDVFDFAEDTQRDPGRIIDAHPRLAASLARFAAAPGRRIVVLVGTSDALLATDEKAAQVLRGRYHAEIGCSAELHIETGAGERAVRIEHGTALATNDGAHAEAERVIAAGGAGLISGATHAPELATLGNGFYANCGS